MGRTWRREKRQDKSFKKQALALRKGKKTKRIVEINYEQNNKDSSSVD